MSLLIRLFSLSSARQMHRSFCRTVYSWQTRNKFFSASQNKQLVVIKTEREAREEKRVTEMSGKKKRNCLDIMKEETKPHQDCPKFCYRRDKQEGSSTEGKDYITVLILWLLPAAKRMANPIAHGQKWRAIVAGQKKIDTFKCIIFKCIISYAGASQQRTEAGLVGFQCKLMTSCLIPLLFNACVLYVALTLI